MTNNGWRTASLGDKTIALTASGGTPDRSDPSNFGGDIPWVKSGELNDGIISSTEEKLTQHGLHNSSAKLFPRGSLLLAMYGATAGKTGILGIEATTNQAVCAIFPQGDSFDCRFLQFQLIYCRPKLMSARSGGAQPNISQRVIATLDVLLPPIDEQRAIASALDAVQKAKEERQRELALERERKAALMEFLFTHGTRGEPTKQTEIGEIPDSWTISTIEEVRADFKGSLVAGPFGSNIGKRFFVVDGVPVIRGNNLTKGDRPFRDSGFVFITHQKAEELKSCEALPNDLVITAAGTVGQIGLIPTTALFPRYIISNKQIRLRVNNRRVRPRFLFYWLASGFAQDFIERRKSGTSIPVINLSIVRQLPVLLPSLSEQEDIESILLAQQAKIEAIEGEASLLEELFRAMVEELMTGQLSTVPLIEERSMQ
jgi:type I restriction enzyme, S subunit